MKTTSFPRRSRSIQVREDGSIPILGAVNVMGMIPPSTKPNVDDAVFGVATWEKWDAKSDRFSIYVRGLSDGYKEIPAPSGGKPTVKYKTLRIDFIRRGDERNIHEKEIQLADPPSSGSTGEMSTAGNQAWRRVIDGVGDSQPVECRPADLAGIAPAAR